MFFNNCSNCHKPCCIKCTVQREQEQRGCGCGCNCCKQRSCCEVRRPQCECRNANRCCGMICKTECRPVGFDGGHDGGYENNNGCGNGYGND